MTSSPGFHPSLLLSPFYTTSGLPCLQVGIQACTSKFRKHSLPPLKLGDIHHGSRACPLTDGKGKLLLKVESLLPKSRGRYWIYTLFTSYINSLRIFSCIQNTKWKVKPLCLSKISYIVKRTFTFLNIKVHKKRNI